MLTFKTSLGLIALAAVATFGPASAQTTIGCFVPGECQGLYTAIAVRSDQYACNEYCTNDVPTCRYWTFFAESEACFAFADCPLDTENCAIQGDCTSGDKGCEQFQCDRVGQCFGNTVGDPLVTVSGDDCLQACKNSAECTWYSWDSGNNFCTLLSDCPVLDESHLDFEAGEKGCPVTPDPTDPGVVNKIMVTGGLGADDAAIDIVDVYDLSADMLTCPSPSKLPYGIDAPTLLFEQTKAAWLCGGQAVISDQNDDLIALNECLVYDAKTNMWTVAPANMNAGRYEAAGFLLNSESIVMAGGRNSANRPQLSSEIWQANQFEVGPQLPLQLAGHCLLKLDDVHFILIGGIDEQGARSKKVYRYNTLDQEWETLSDLANARDMHSCQIIDSENQERGRELIVVGGGNGATLTSTEILKVDDLTAASAWRAGPDFPVPIKEAASVPYGNTMKVLGGQDGNTQNMVVYDSIYQYDAGFQIWRNDTVTPTLARAARRLTAVMVDSVTVNCDAPAPFY